MLQYKFQIPIDKKRASSSSFQPDNRNYAMYIRDNVGDNAVFGFSAGALLYRKEKRFETSILSNKT